MAIEITSMPDRRRSVLRQLPALFARLARGEFSPHRQPLLRPVLALLLLSFCVGGDALVRSYEYYSRVIDARLASGYLTSRPGLYAAPRTIRPGQGFDRTALVKLLQRAGYVENKASDVWSGSFTQEADALELRPRHTDKPNEPRVVRVNFLDDRIAGLTTDDVALDSFTLEPEVLTNDLSSKSTNRKTLAYVDIPPVLVHAILATEDRRFFQHPGLDLFGIGRAVLRNAGDETIGQGGSTISQQLVKNTYLSPERTFRRKYAEAMLA